MKEILGEIKSKEKLEVKNNVIKMGAWVIATNICLGLGLYYVTGKLAAPVMPILIALGFIGPVISLLTSKWQVKKVYRMITLNSEMALDEKEKYYYNIVKKMSEKLEIEMPEVCVWESKEVNAFATGMNKNKALVAVSTSLLNQFDEEELAGVIGHEMAHIINGDMITMTLLRGVINTIVWVICAPFLLYYWFAKLDDKSTARGLAVIYFVYMLVRKVSSFGGELIANYFSRHREFKADSLSARLTSESYMEKALKKLQNIEIVEVRKEELAYASFKINSQKAIFDIFSTHPNLERRIEKLKKEKI